MQGWILSDHLQHVPARGGTCSPTASQIMLQLVKINQTNPPGPGLLLGSDSWHVSI